VIENELLQLYGARRVLSAMAAESVRSGSDAALQTQFMRVWNDSAKTMALLLRLRHELAGPGEAEALQQEAYELLESYPGLRLLAAEPSAGTPHDGEQGGSSGE
jgi:hypothetical protein